MSTNQSLRIFTRALASNETADAPTTTAKMRVTNLNFY